MTLRYVVFTCAAALQHWVDGTALFPMLTLHLEMVAGLGIARAEGGGISECISE